MINWQDWSQPQKKKNCKPRLCNLMDNKAKGMSIIVVMEDIYPHIKEMSEL